MLVDLFGLSKQLEVLLIITAGIAILSFDSSLFQMKSNLEELWNYEFHPKLQEYNMQLFLKYILSGVIVVRTFTTHIFLALYVVMLWPAIFEERPSLMVPWLMVGSVRYVALNVVTLVTGSYICISQKGHHPICFDFFLSQIIDHGPSFYAWLTIWSYYKDLQGQCEEKQKRKSVQLEIATRRRRAKLMNSSQYEERLEDGNVLEDLISQSTLSTLIHKLESDSWSSSLSRSLDSLLKLQSTKDVTEEIMFSDSMVDDMQSTSINQRVMKILDINEDELRKILLGRDSASLINTHEERQYSDSQNGDNMEKIIQQFASDRHKALVAKNKENANVEKEIELGSYTFDMEAANVTEPGKEYMTEIKDESNVNTITEAKDTEGKVEATPENPMNPESKVSATEAFLEKVVDVVRDIKNMNDIGCQVSTLSRMLLNQPAEEVTRRFNFSKKIIWDVTIFDTSSK